MKPKFIKYITYAMIGIVSIIVIVVIGNTIKINNSEAYNIAKKEIINNQEIIKSIGTVEGFGKFPSGSIKMENGMYYAQLEIDAIGSEKEAEIIVFMEKINEKWILKDMFIND